MTHAKIDAKTHPAETELSDLLSGELPSKKREGLMEHIASCDECLASIVSAYESVEAFGGPGGRPDRKERIVKKINIYLFCAMVAFLLSFLFPGHFLQFLVAAAILGLKWIADSKSTKMLIMIHEAWKKGGEKEASKVIEKISSGKRF